MPRPTGLLSSNEFCFTIFKPDAIELGIVPQLVHDIGALGLELSRRAELQLTTEDVCIIWPVITHPHTSRTVPYMTSRTVEIGLVSGADATLVMMGLKRRVREQYPHPNPVISVIHTTDCDEELERCTRHFYGENDL